MCVNHWSIQSRRSDDDRCSLNLYLGRHTSCSICAVSRASLACSFRKYFDPFEPVFFSHLNKCGALFFLVLKNDFGGLTLVDDLGYLIWVSE
jgi:hypothetical protein